MVACGSRCGFALKVPRANIEYMADAVVVLPGFSLEEFKGAAKDGKGAELSSVQSDFSAWKHCMQECTQRERAWAQWIWRIGGL